MIIDPIIRQAISRILIQNVFGKNKDTEEQIIIPDDDLANNMLRLADQLSSIKYALAETGRRIDGVEGEDLEAGDILYSDLTTNKITTVQEAIYNLFLDLRGFRQLVGQEIGDLRRSNLDNSLEIARVDGKKIEANSIFYGETTAHEIFNTLLTDIEKVQRTLIEYAEWIDEVEAKKPKADDIIYKDITNSGANDLQSATQQLFIDARNTRQAVLREIGALNLSIQQANKRIQEISERPIDATETTYHETTLEDVLNDLLKETGSIWVGINSAFERIASLEKETVHAKGTWYDDITPNGLKNAQDALHYLFVQNQQLKSLFESSAVRVEAAAAIVEKQPVAWGVLGGEAIPQNSPKVNEPIYHEGQVIVGDKKAKSRGANLENRGSFATGSSHALLGVDSMASGKNNLTGENGFSFGESNQAGGRNSLSGGERNRAGGIDSAVVNGADNIADSPLTFIGAGDLNKVTQPKGFIGAGSQNLVARPHGFVGAGFQNKVQGEAGTIPGGYRNEANGDYSTVPGGIDNTANGKASVALGAHSKANHDGSLVWHDAQPTDFSSVRSNEVAMWGSGGFRFRSDLTGLHGVDLPVGGNGWVVACPQTDESKYFDIDAARVLSALANVPVRVYQYPGYRFIPIKGEIVETESNLLNLGTSADHWDAVFGEILGTKTLKNATINENGESLITELPGIATGDQIGALMLSVQELLRLVQAQADRIDQLEQHLIK